MNREYGFVMVEFQELRPGIPIVATLNNFNEKGKHGIFLAILNLDRNHDEAPYTLPTVDTWRQMQIHNYLTYREATIRFQEGPDKVKHKNIYFANADGEIYNDLTKGFRFNGPYTGLDNFSQEIVKEFHHRYDQFHDQFHIDPRN